VASDTLALPETVEPTSEPADRVTFRVENEGDEQHSLAVGTAILAPKEVRLEGAVAAGEARVLTAQLQPGTYMAYCPINGHQARERTTFTVAR
jgi:uncharacterized cupredoxin-like copper-binding protein